MSRPFVGATTKWGRLLRRIGVGRRLRRWQV